MSGSVETPLYSEAPALAGVGRQLRPIAHMRLSQ
jgi:hypothetical protein